MIVIEEVSFHIVTVYMGNRGDGDRTHCLPYILQVPACDVAWGGGYEVAEEETGT